MRRALASGLLMAAIVIALNASMWAQDFDAGETEYLSKCATCHGADGKGTGPLSAPLKIRPADLTTLAKRNNGTFSPKAIYEMIDGRTAVRPHRSIDMPIWGCRHAAPPLSRTPPANCSRHSAKKRLNRPKSKSALSILDLPCDPEPVIRSRILAVVEYLNRIQER